MKIQILGKGCAKCNSLEQNAREAVAQSGVDAEVVKITDSDAITTMGVMMTPAIAIDGEVKKAGKVVSPDEIVKYIKGEK